MKNYILISILSILFAHQSQAQTCEIKGQVRGVTVGEITFIPVVADSAYYGRDYDIPTAKIVGGKFFLKKDFSSKITLAYRCLIKSLDETYLTGVLLLKAGKQEILIERLNEYASPKIISDPILTQQSLSYENKFKDFLNRLEQYYILLDSCDEIRNSSVDCYGDDPAVVLRDFESESDSLFLTYSNENPSSEFLMWKLIERINNIGFDEGYKQITSSFPATLLKGSAGIKLQQEVFKSRALSVSTKALPFSLLSSANETVTIDSSYFKGKFTLVEFWFSGCAPCERQFEEIRKLQVPNANFQVLTISTDSKEKSPEWFARIEKQDKNWKNLLDLDASFANNLTVNSFPTSFLVDENGLVVARNLPISSLQKLLFREYSKVHIYREDGFEPE